MLAVFRVSFGTTPVTVWRDELVANLFDPTIPFSVAHFWTRTSFGDANMRMQLFPPIAMEDPRPSYVDKEDSNQLRLRLGRAAVAAVSAQLAPDWGLYEGAVMLFTGDTGDAAGFALPPFPVRGADGTWRLLGVAIVDETSRFSTLGHEVGHAFGYAHEVDPVRGDEYASPYSILSTGHTWYRDADSRLSPLVPPPVGGIDPLRVIGPFLTPAQLLAAGKPALQHADSVTFLPAELTQPTDVRLVALDRAIAEWPVRRHCVAVIPPSPTRLKTYVLELRRPQDYDKGVSFGPKKDGEAGIVIHSFNPATKRVYYEGVLPVTGASGDLDFRSFSGGFIVRYLSSTADRGEVVVRVSDASTWTTRGVQITSAESSPGTPQYSLPTQVLATPCGPDTQGTYTYRTAYGTTSMKVKAVSFGYEKPGYRWQLNGVPLQGGPYGQFVKPLPVKTAQGPQLVDSGPKNVLIMWGVNAGELSVTFPESYAGIPLQIAVTVHESSQEVMQNAYPESTTLMDVQVNNLWIEWDAAYTAARAGCWRKYWQQHDGLTITGTEITFDRRPQIDPRILELFRRSFGMEGD